MRSPIAYGVGLLLGLALRQGMAKELKAERELIQESRFRRIFILGQHRLGRHVR